MTANRTPRTVIILSILATALCCLAGFGAEAPKLLCTTFPVYQLARNVTAGRSGLSLELLLPAGLGCPHDYALTPQDMRKLAGAGVLLVNGLGLEEFLGAPVQKANPQLQILDSSAGLDGLLHLDGSGHNHAACGAGCQDHAGHKHGETAVNPHLFASPRQAARLALNIAAALGRLDPEGAPLYAANAEKYAARLNALADEFAALGRSLRNPRIVQPHGIMDYLARDMGLKIVAVTLPHGQQPAAAEMLRLVRVIRDKTAAAVFSEPQYPDKVAATLAREAGVRAAVFDPVASGPADAGLEYYETVMRRNLETLRQALGGE